jgi:hypothetical protein
MLFIAFVYFFSFAGTGNSFRRTTGSWSNRRKWAGLSAAGEKAAEVSRSARFEQGCQIYLRTTYQTGKMYQMTKIVLHKCP